MHSPNGEGRSLRRRLAGDGVVRLVGAHNALGAKMAVRAGFDGVWSSGFELSASYGVPDASIVTMTEHLAAVQAMRHVVSVPIVADCDTGYGDAYNSAHMTRRFEAAGVSAVCIEDKHFPKRNSFMDSAHQLLEPQEFGDKIAAACAARTSPQTLVVARTEALVVGLGAEEALDRLATYADAGADAVLLHSKARSVEPLAEALAGWDRRVPVVVVPTTYPQVTVDQLDRLGVKMVIYANQGLRSALRAMGRTYAEILDSGTAGHLEAELFSLRSVFDLQGAGDLEVWRGNGAAKSPAEKASGNGSAGVSTLPAERPKLDGAELGRWLLHGVEGRKGVDFATGVPDSTTKGLFRWLEADPERGYVAAVSEEAAVGLAVGTYLGGRRRPMVVMQNSGLGTAITALASLPCLYEIPLLLVIGWRGDDGPPVEGAGGSPGGTDAAEHWLIGKITLDLLRRLEIPFVVLSADHPRRDVARVLDLLERGRPAALVVRRGSSS